MKARKIFWWSMGSITAFFTSLFIVAVIFDAYAGNIFQAIFIIMIGTGISGMNFINGIDESRKSRRREN
mgnify:CR=1 FL=1